MNILLYSVQNRAIANIVKMFTFLETKLVLDMYFSKFSLFSPEDRIFAVIKSSYRHTLDNSGNLLAKFVVIVVVACPV